MQAVFAVFVGVMIIWVIAKAASTPSLGSGSSPTPRGYQSLMQSGVAGRGILLSVSNRSFGSSGVGMYKYQSRSVTIDVEVPGRPPYEASVIVLVPLHLVRDVLPGATVELRVDPSDPNNMAIVGPGVGFNAATLMTQGQINQGAA